MRSESSTVGVALNEKMTRYMANPDSMKDFQIALTTFLEENSKESVGNNGCFASLVLLPFHLTWLLLKLIGLLSVLPFVLVLLVISLGKVNLFAWSKERTAKQKARKLAEKDFMYDTHVYLHMSKRNNSKSVEPVLDRALDYLDQKRLPGEEVIYAIATREQGVFFTQYRMIYKLESPKKLSMKDIYGEQGYKDIEELSARKTTTDGIDFLLNGKKFGHIPKIGADCNYDRINRLLQVTQKHSRSIE